MCKSVADPGFAKGGFLLVFKLTIRRCPIPTHPQNKAIFLPTFYVQDTFRYLIYAFEFSETRRPSWSTWWINCLSCLAVRFSRLCPAGCQQRWMPGRIIHTVCWTRAHFVEPLVPSVLYLQWLSPWVLNPGWISHQHTYWLACHDPRSKFRYYMGFFPQVGLYTV